MTERALDSLVAGLAEVPSGVEISDVTLSSREATPGALFLACQGHTAHGLVYARDAIARGARAVLWEPAPGVDVPDFPSGIVAAPVPHLGLHAGEIADRFFDSPSAHVTAIGVTGTNGKTTAAWLLAQALTICGRGVRYSGTLGYGRPGALHATAYTTPDAVKLQRQLAALRDDGARGVALEVSSHALDQARVRGVRFHTAIFTNLSRDHLDYHGSMERYAEAKARLFTWPTLALRIINIDDAFGAQLAQRSDGQGRLVTVARQRDAMIRATRTELTSRGIELDIESQWGRGRLPLALIGDFNADNALAVLAVLLSWDIDWNSAVAALGSCTPPPGRMETFGGHHALPLVIVDYAHTPDALDKALVAARAHGNGRVIVVFGCGGDRDRGKRPLMGAVAARLADAIVLTDDNPRSESPTAIVAEIRAGISADREVAIIHDRAQAIEHALALAAADDLVLIAGKGHEDYQIFGATRLPFSDQDVVRDALVSRVPGALQ